MSVTSVSVVKTPALSDKDVNVSGAFSFTESPLHKPKQQAKIEGFFKNSPGRQQSKGTRSEPSLPAMVQTAQDTSWTAPKSPTVKKPPVAVFKKLEFSSSADSLGDWADMDDFDMSASDAFASLAENPATRVSTAQKPKKTKRNFFKPPPRKATSVKTDLTPPSPECLQVDLTKEQAEGADLQSRDVICLDNDSASEELTEKDTQQSQSLKAHLGAERGSHHLILVTVLSNLKLSIGSSGTQDSCVLEALALCSAGLSSVTLDMKKVGLQRLE